MEHTSESSTLNFTEKSQDSKFVAQMLAATNVIPSESIQFQTLKSTNSSNKRECKNAYVTQLLNLYEKDGLAVEKEGFRERDWVEIANKLDEAWPMISKRMSKQCRGKVDKM